MTWVAEVDGEDIMVGVPPMTTMQQDDGVGEVVRMVVDVVVMLEEDAIIRMIMTAMMGRKVIAAVEELEVNDQIGEEVEVIIGIQWVEDMHPISMDAAGGDDEVLTTCR